MFANGSISSSSRRQKIVTLSPTESEYVAATTAAREAVWLRKLLKEIGSPCDKCSCLSNNLTSRSLISSTSKFLADNMQS